MKLVDGCKFLEVGFEPAPIFPERAPDRPYSIRRSFPGPSIMRRGFLHRARRCRLHSTMLLREGCADAKSRDKGGEETEIGAGCYVAPQRQEMSRGGESLGQEAVDSPEAGFASAGFVSIASGTISRPSNCWIFASASSIPSRFNAENSCTVNGKGWPSAST